MNEQRQASRVILHHGASILVLQAHGEDFMHLVGGGVDPGEDPLQCIVRELREEIGYGLSYLHFLTIIHHTWTTAPVDETMFLYRGVLHRDAVINRPLARESWLTSYWIPWWNADKVNLQPQEVYPWIAPRMGGR